MSEGREGKREEGGGGVGSRCGGEEVERRAT